VNRRRLRLMRVGLARLIAGRPVLPFVDGDGTWIVARSMGAVAIMEVESVRVVTKMIRTGDPLRPFRPIARFHGRLRSNVGLVE